MNYSTTLDGDDSANVRIRTNKNDGVSVPLPPPSAMANFPRVTKDSSPEKETAQNQFDETDTGKCEMAALDLHNNVTLDPNSHLKSTSTEHARAIAPPPTTGSNESQSNWNVKDDWRRSVPSFYPLEKSNRTVKGATASVVSGRVSDCCRLLSVQAEFDDKAGTASLTTAEHVEIHLSLWSAGGDGEPACIIVEAQRRTGDPIKYHQYIRHILDAAQGTFNAVNVGSSNLKTDVMDKKEKGSSQSNDDKSLSALEIAAILIKKDRMDARRLGMESLCFLTDPSRTGVDTALVASRAVLFGSAQNDNDDDVEFLADELGVREAILSLVQYGRLNESNDMPPDSDSDEDTTRIHDEEKSFNDILHNLALAVLSNALEVLETHGDDFAPSSESKLSQATNDFLKESKEISHRELIDSLLNVLGQAEAKPHDACLSAQCLRSLLQASKKARRKARDMNAKQIVATALEVGQRTHVKLQTETLGVLRELEKPEDEDREDDN